MSTAVFIKPIPQVLHRFSVFFGLSTKTTCESFSDNHVSRYHSLITCLAIFATTGSWGGTAWGRENTSPYLTVPNLLTAFSSAPDKPPIDQRQRRKHQIPDIQVGGVPHTEAKETRQSQSGQAPTPLKIGEGLRVSATDTIQKLAATWVWDSLADGSHVAAIRFVSEGATGTRLVLAIENLDPRATVVFSGATEGETTEVSGYDVHNTLFRNLAERPGAPASRTYVGPYIQGSVVTLEVYLPSGVSPSTQKIAIPTLSRISVSPDAPGAFQKIGESGSCHADIKCEANWENTGRGVARMVFTDTSTGSSYLCTGSLVNDTSNSTTPYFLTANHCIDTQSAASTLQTFWFYQASACQSGTSAYTAQARSGGATLLHTQTSTDTSLLRLNQAPPSGVNYLGWSVETVTNGTAIAGVHHPKGDVQKISTGTSIGYANCKSSYCLGSSSASGTHIAVRWTRGVTEPGSSGSGLFREINGTQYLIGTLTGGTSSCTNPTGFDVYGRFDTPFNQGLSTWLRPSSTSPVEPSAKRTPVYRFYNTATNAHFFTGSAAERDWVVATLPSYVYEGEAFYAYSAATAGLSPVYRFYNTATGAHFYTINLLERDHVAAAYPTFGYEGPAWHAKTGSDGSNSPLFRFFNRDTGTHFYTMSAAERDHIIATRPTYQYEGVGYYAWSGQ